MEKLLFEAVFAENSGGWVARFKHRLTNLLAVGAGDFEVLGFNFLAIILAAIFAASWFIAKTLLVKEFLLASGPDKLVAAILTDEGFIDKFHVKLF